MDRNALHYAIIDHKTDKAKQLILSGNIDLNAQDKNGYTALHFAAQYKNVDIARLLIEKGAKPDLIDDWGNTPLWRALGPSEDNAQLINLLISSGIDPTTENESGVSVISHVRKIKTHPNRDLFKKWL
jgi:uncharacterized protein